MSLHPYCLTPLVFQGRCFDFCWCCCFMFLITQNNRNKPTDVLYFTTCNIYDFKIYGNMSTAQILLSWQILTVALNWIPPDASRNLSQTKHGVYWFRFFHICLVMKNADLSPIHFSLCFQYSRTRSPTFHTTTTKHQHLFVNVRLEVSLTFNVLSSNINFILCHFFKHSWTLIFQQWYLN